MSITEVPELVAFTDQMNAAIKEISTLDAGTIGGVLIGGGVEILIRAGLPDAQIREHFEMTLGVVRSFVNNEGS